MIKLCGDETRFPASDIDCPVCNNKVLMDNWPPNYFSGGLYYDSDGKMVSSGGGTLKVVCAHCKTASLVVMTHKNDQWTRQFVKTEPLVEMDGRWLTPYDVDQEEYKKEHGTYRRDVYA